MHPRRQQPQHGAGNHRLAGAGFTDQTGDLAWVQPQVQLFDRVRPVGAARQRDTQPLDRQHGWHQGKGVVHRSRSLGFNASFRPSPTKLIASTVARIARPGNVQIHQAERSTSRPALIIRPQLIRFGSPRPRKDRPDSNRITLATNSEPTAISGEAQFGSKWRKTMRPSPAPSPPQASTNSRPPREANSPRASRAMPGQDTRAMAAISLSAEGERIATSRIANMKDGIVWNNSVTRISATSSLPR